jgi:hypothetical protein
MYSLFVALAVSGVLIAGCGSSSKPKAKASTTKPAATTTTPKTASTTPATASTTPATASTTPAITALSGAELKAAAVGCKSAEANDTTLPSSVKAYLSKICSDLEAGNVDAFKTDVAKYCSALVAASPAAEKAAAQAECQEVDKL